MQRPNFLAISFVVLFLGLGVSSSILVTVYSQESGTIPSWIRNTAGWWSNSQISDEEFTKGLEYLIQNDIIEVPQTSALQAQKSDHIPSWLQKNAGWWSQGLLSDDEFVKGIQYLINNGIIVVETNIDSFSCSGSSLCITGKIERIIDGDTIYVEGHKIRLSLTNTPEKNEFGFSDATGFTRQLCPVGSFVTIDQDDMQPYDVYGRVLAKVHCGDKVLNSELLSSGHASILTQYCSTSEFANESWAQKFGCGTNQNIPAKSNEPIKSNEESESNNNCDPSYPDFCIPSPPPDLDCKDIPQKRFTVIQPDPHRFDGDKDGIGCES